MDISILSFIFIIVFASLSLRIVEEYYYEACACSSLFNDSQYYYHINNRQKNDIEMGLGV